MCCAGTKVEGICRVALRISLSSPLPLFPLPFFDLTSPPNADLTEVMTQGEVKGVLQQLCSAVSYMHSKFYFHRDLKTSNILVHKSGKVSICDFGLARKFDKPLRADYTQMVITLWYRPPELLLGETTYGPEVDMWR